MAKAFSSSTRTSCDRVVDGIAQGLDDEVLIAVEQARALAGARFGAHLLPQAEQRAEVAIEGRLRLVEGVGAQDDAHALGQSSLALAIFDRLPVVVLGLAGDAAGLVVGHQDQVAAGDAEVGGDEGALVADAVADDLDQDRLAALQDPVDAGVLAAAVGLLR